MNLQGASHRQNVFKSWVDVCWPRVLRTAFAYECEQCGSRRLFAFQVQVCVRLSCAHDQRIQKLLHQLKNLLFSAEESWQTFQMPCATSRIVYRRSFLPSLASRILRQTLRHNAQYGKEIIKTASRAKWNRFNKWNAKIAGQQRRNLTTHNTHDGRLRVLWAITSRRDLRDALSDFHSFVHSWNTHEHFPTKWQAIKRF